jgi:thioredoxin reductase (NADPH)
MVEPQITIYGACWCPDCRRSKQFLGEFQIPYHWVDIEQDEAGEQYVLARNEGQRIIPTIEFADGSILVEPTNADLADKLGLKTSAERHHYDLIVIGGGPTGLTTGVYAAREGIETLVVERSAIGGQAATTQWLDNVPGFADGIDGASFVGALEQQARRFGVEILQAQNVARVHSRDNYHFVDTAAGDKYNAHALLLATGSRYRRLGIPGEEEYVGAGVHFCATCDGPFYKGQRVAVIGGGNSAAEESVRTHTEAVAFRGEANKLKAVVVEDNRTGDRSEICPAGVFVFIGQQPNSGFLEGSGVRLDRWGFVVTGHDLMHGDSAPIGYEGREPTYLETSLPGVFAAGDVRAGSTKQVVSAAGEGATAALLIREYLQHT